MPRKTYTRDSIIQTLQSLAQRLEKDTLSHADVQGVIPISTVKSRFASLGNALEAAGLRRKALGENLANRGPRYTDDEMFQALLELEKRLGHEPLWTEMKAFGGISSSNERRLRSAKRCTSANAVLWRAN